MGTLRSEDADLHCDFAKLMVMLGRDELAKAAGTLHNLWAVMSNNMPCDVPYAEAEEHYQRAMMLYEKALERDPKNRDPKNAAIHYNYANLLKKLKWLKEAAKHYKTALKLDPECAD